MLTGVLHFDFPLGWQIGLPLSVALLSLTAWRMRRGGLSTARVACLTSLRGIALLLLVFLASRPVWVANEPISTAQRPVLLLVDRSESMSLEENDHTRYQQALNFARNHLLPALKSAGLPVMALNSPTQSLTENAPTSAALLAAPWPAILFRLWL